MSFPSQHRFPVTMPTTHATSVAQHRGSAPDPATVLALVATTIELDDDADKALRLVCRATRRAVDEAIAFWRVTEKKLKLWADLNLTTPITPFTSGFVGITCTIGAWEDTMDLSFQMINFLIIATHNSQSLESLVLRWRPILASTQGAKVARTAAAMLGAREWPKLKDLTITIAPSTLSAVFNHYSTPSFTALRKLSVPSKLSVDDIATLSRLEHLCSKLEDLCLGKCFVSGESACYDHMERLLKNLPSVRFMDITLLALPRLTSSPTPSCLL
jgi:hypothetical protein